MQMFQSCSCVWFLHSVVPHALSPPSCCWIGASVETTWNLLSMGSAPAGLEVAGLIYHDDKHKNGHVVVSFTLLTLSFRHWLLFLLGDEPRTSAHSHMCTFLSKDWRTQREILNRYLSSTQNIFTSQIILLQFMFCNQQHRFAAVIDLENYFHEMQKKEQRTSTVCFFVFFLDETGGWNIYMNLLQNKGQRLFDVDLKHLNFRSYLQETLDTPSAHHRAEIHPQTNSNLDQRANPSRIRCSSLICNHQFFVPFYTFSKNVI